MKKKLISILTVIGDFIKQNKGVVSQFTILILITLISALCASNALFGACVGAIAHTGLGKVLDILGLTFATTSRPSILGIAIGTILAMIII